MGYYDVALLTTDTGFLQRVAACYAQEEDSPYAVEPNVWATQNNWEMAAQPGFGDAYASARAGENPAPGTDPSVITDGMILSGVQSILTAEASG